MTRPVIGRSCRPAALLLGTLLAVGAHAAATFSLVNLDAAGSGLNDPSPFTPVGNNTATTLGQARQNVINEAGRIWGQRLNSAQPIVVEARMAADTCTATTGTLASAGPKTFFSVSSMPQLLLPAALADALTGTNNNSRNDISLSINSTIGTGATCLNGRSFYLGLDHANGNNVDLLNVLLHEFGHGLGFLSLADEAGVQPKDPSVTTNSVSLFTGYEQYAFEENSGKYWCGMKDDERAAASVVAGTLVFNSPSVNANIGGYTTATGLSLAGRHLRLYAPATYSDGSSVSHWDSVANPNLLMEPFITPNTQGLTDLTGCVLRDIGWPGARCPDPQGASQVPLAFNQCAAVLPGTATTVTLTGSTVSGSGSLTYAIVTPPNRGVLTPPANATGSSGVAFVYTPNAGVTGADSFTFRVSDGVNTSAAATVSLTVAAVNRIPVANAQSVSLRAGATLPITLSGSDPDGNTITYRTVAPAHGTLSGTPPNVTYAPAAGYAGADSFDFRVNDGQLSSIAATVSITVVGNTAPVATAQSVTVQSGRSVAITLAGTDADNDALTYAVVAGTGPGSGTLSGTAPALTYTPNAGFTGTDSFQFRANDGQTNSAAATVTISVTAAPAASGGGGGGFLDDLALAMLALLLVQSGAWSPLARRFGARPATRS